MNHTALSLSAMMVNSVSENFLWKCDREEDEHRGDEQFFSLWPGGMPVHRQLLL